jgi:hypothetical protein
MRLYTVILLILFFVLHSCADNRSSYEEDVNRNEVIGNWGLTDESSYHFKKDSIEIAEVKDFFLNSDSSADIYFSNGDKSKGSWLWNMEKDIQAENSELNVIPNLEISYRYKNKTEILLFEINHTDGLMLNLDKDLYYEKK